MIPPHSVHTGDGIAAEVMTMDKTADTVHCYQRGGRSSTRWTVTYTNGPHTLTLHTWRFPPERIIVVAYPDPATGHTA